MSPSEPTQTDAAKVFDDRLQAEIGQLFKDLAQQCRYEDFSHLTVQTYTRYMNLAVMDLFTGHSDEEKATRLNITVEDMFQSRDLPDFKALRYNLSEHFDRLKIPMGMRDHLDDIRLQSRVAKRLERNALHAKDPRESNKAAELLLDRMAPRLTREETQTIVMIDTSQLELMQSVEAELAAAGRPVLEATIVRDDEEE